MLDFANYTEREQITKCLQFAGLPTEATKRTIEEGRYHELNAEIIDLRIQVRQYYDAFIIRLISQALENADFDFSNSKYEGFETDKSKMDLIKKDLTSYCSDKINSQIKSIGLRKAADINSAAFIKDVLTSFVQGMDGTEEEKEKAKETVEKLNGFAGLMSRFAISRISLLTKAADRAAENFERYVSNISRVSLFVNSGLREAEEFIEKYPEIITMANVGYYNVCMTPEGIEGYNTIINGVYSETTHEPGYNQVVNELNAKNRADMMYAGPFFRQMNPLYQQMLIPKEKVFTVSKVSNDDELREVLKESMDMFGVDTIKELLVFINESVQDFYVSGKSVDSLSAELFGGFKHDVLSDKLIASLVVCLENEKQNTTKKSEIRKIDEKIAKASLIVRDSYYSISNLEQITGLELTTKICASFRILADNVTNSAKELNSIHVCEDGIRIFGNKRNTLAVKEYSDALISVRQALKMFSVTGCDDVKPEVEASVTHFMEVFQRGVFLQNVCRNYLTRSSRDSAKDLTVPMYFGMAAKDKTKWWTGEKKLQKNDSVLIKMSDGYYYGTSADVKPFYIPAYDGIGKSCSVLVQKKGQKAMMLLPSRVFNKSVKAAFEDPNCMEVDNVLNVTHPIRITREDYDMYKSGAFTTKMRATDPEKYRQALNRILELYIEFANAYKEFEKFSFEFKKPEEYADSAEFFAYMDTRLVSMEWYEVSEDGIRALDEMGQLMLFKIWHRDLYRSHTNDSYVVLFKELFTADNMESVSIQLNAAPSITYRPAIMADTYIHDTGSTLVNKKASNGEYIPGNVYQELLSYYNNEKKELSKEAKTWLPYVKTKIADKDYIKNRRYTHDQYTLIFSYTKNKKVTESRNYISQEIKEEMKGDRFCTMSVIRGVKDLAYYIVYDENHQLVEKGSLNEVYGIDYSAKLRQLSDARVSAKKEEWDYGTEVKNVKAAYIDFVISKILSIATKYNAVIVVENISDRIKDKQSAIDNVIYKVFEDRLENRLMDYYDKKAESGKPGSIRNPLQLASKNGKRYIQNGILYKISNSYTKNLCPETGFVNLFSFGSVRLVREKREFIGSFDRIWINKDTGFVDFTFRYESFAAVSDVIKGVESEAAKYLRKKIWTVQAGGFSVYHNREAGRYEPIDDCAELARELIVHYNIEEESNLAALADSMQSDLLDSLFELFRSTVAYPVIPATKANERIFRSPITHGVTNPSEVAAENLARKFWKWVSAENGESFLLDWLSNAQRNCKPES